MFGHFCRRTFVCKKVHFICIELWPPSPFVAIVLHSVAFLISHPNSDLLHRQMWRSLSPKGPNGRSTQEPWWATLCWPTPTSEVNAAQKLTHAREPVLSISSLLPFLTQSTRRWRRCCSPPACASASCSRCWPSRSGWPAGGAGSAEATDAHPSHAARLWTTTTTTNTSRRRRRRRRRMTRMKMMERKQKALWSRQRKGRRYRTGRKWLMWARPQSGRRGSSAERWSSRRYGWTPIWTAARVNKTGTLRSVSRILSSCSQPWIIHKARCCCFFFFFYILKQFIVCFDIFKEHSVYEECHFIGLYCSTSQFLGDQQGSNV